MSARRDASAAATRAAILATARELFVAHGYETVTIRQVAKAAGKSTGALFAHWTGKDALFAEAMGRPPFTDVMGERLAQALRDAGVHPATVSALAQNRAVY